MEQPIYQKIMDTLREEVAKMTPNTPILSERELEKKYHASRMTVRKAVRKLVDEGVLYRKDNLGTFVADQKLHKKSPTSAVFESFDTDKDYKIIYFDVKDENHEVAKQLEISLYDQFIRIVRLNLKEKTPESLDYIYIVRRMVDDSLMNDTTSLLAFSAKMQTGSVNQIFIPMIVPVMCANLLKLKINTPIIRVDSKINTKNGRVFAYIQSYVNPNIKNIEITM